MIFKVLEDGKIWIQFILVEGTAEERERYSTILPRYGSYFYVEEDIIEFISDKPSKIPSAMEARSYVEGINKELDITVLIEA